jgi:lipoic acid synthetase
MSGRLSARHQVKVRLRRASLNTVCEEARCPNMSECFGSHTATFLVLGDCCTRSCRFCAISKNREPTEPDPDEPRRLAEAIGQLGLEHAVITSVTRDDLPDGGAGHFASCIEEIRRLDPSPTVEVLVPDFARSAAALQAVLDASPEVFNHNLETVPRLYPLVRPQADIAYSLSMLARAAASDVGLTKSGLMVGLGEEAAEVVQVLRQLKQAGCQAVTIGQYLQPLPGCLPVAQVVTDEQFRSYRSAGERLGLQILAGPLIRSSYHARQLAGF